MTATSADGSRSSDPSSRDAPESLGFSRFFHCRLNSSKKNRLMLDTAEQDVITALASGGEPSAPAVSHEEAVAINGKMPG